MPGSVGTEWGDSGTAGRHGPSLSLLSGQLSPGRGPTEPQAFICPGLRLETQAGSLTLWESVVRSLSHTPNQVCPPPSTGSGRSRGRRTGLSRSDRVRVVRATAPHPGHSGQRAVEPGQGRVSLPR